MNIDQLGPYRVESELGHGGMATVYQAFHQPLRRYVALKVLDSLLSRNEEFQQRFEQEARLAAQLDHPNIISIYDLGVADGHQYIAMQLIDGPTLEQVIRETGPLPAARVLAIGTQIAEALGYAHEQGVFHRDVKPSNILLRPNDRPILTDFGIARAVEGLRLTMTRSMVGTPRYMSPEQAQAQPVDSRSDIYSLGVVLYEMLSGRPPFDAPSTPSLLYMHVHQAPPPLSQARPDLSSGVRELVERCLAKSPDDRFQNAGQIAASCRALLTIPGLDGSGATVMMPPLSPAATPRPGTPPGGYQGGPLGTGPYDGGSGPRPYSRPVTPPPTPGPYSRPATPPPAPRSESPSLAEGLHPTTVLPAVGVNPPGGSAGQVTPPPEPGKRFPVPLPLVGGLLAAVVIVGVLIFMFSPGSPTRPTATSVAVASTATVAPAKPTAAPAAATSPAPAVGQPTPAGSSGSPPPVAAPAASDSAARHLSEAMTALGRRDWTTALDQTSAGLKIDPRDSGLAKAAVQARLGAAQDLWARDALDEALTHYLIVREQPLRAAASSAELREAELGGPYLWGELTGNVDLPTALAEYEKVYRRDPNFRDVRNKVYTGNVTIAGQFLARGDRAGAVKYVNAARAADPNRPEANDLLRQLTPTPG